MTRGKVNIPTSALVADAAAERCNFSLTYGRASQPRELYPGGMIGQPIDDVYHPGEQSSGDWDHDAPDGYYDGAVLTEEDFIDHYAGMAISEAVHEALEWFRVDGKPWLDPHDPRAETAIFERVAELVAQLTDLRRKKVLGIS
jgi:hypothetical protein